MGDLPDPPDPIAVPDLLVQARAANLARSALGLRPAVHELVARLRLPLPHERDLDHNKDPAEPMPSWSLRVTVPADRGLRANRKGRLIFRVLHLGSLGRDCPRKVLPPTRRVVGLCGVRRSRHVDPGPVWHDGELDAVPHDRVKS